MKQKIGSPFDRRAVSKELSRLASASVADILADPGSGDAYKGCVIGVTGPPGAGKSTLIARLAAHRLRQVAPIAIVAIDPTSPFSEGSLLGDRVRMDSLSEDPRVFIRSLPSRSEEDGLTENLTEIVGGLDSFGFAEVFIETVGVGQSAYGVRVVADVELLVLTPGAGDYVQAMKAGILETADIFVVTKAEMPGADRVVSDLLGVPRRVPGAVDAPVITVRPDSDIGVAELSDAIDAHCAKIGNSTALAVRRAARQRYRVQRLVRRTLLQALDALPERTWKEPLRDSFAHAVEQLYADARNAWQDACRRADAGAGADNAGTGTDVS